MTLTTQPYFTFITRKDGCTFWVFFDIFNDVNEVGDLREERIVVGEPVNLFMIVARLTNIEYRLHVWVDKSVCNLISSKYTEMERTYFSWYPSAKTSSSQL